MTSELGYSGTPLIKKLDLKPNYRLKVIGEPDNYWELIGEVPTSILSQAENEERLDFVHLFVRQSNELETLLNLKKMIKQNGAIWVSWPKRSSKVHTDLNENIIRDFALGIGLVDVKVCAIDSIWSGLKLVIPLKLRS